MSSASALRPPPSPLVSSPLRAFAALVWFSVRRQGRARAVTWVAFALCGILALVVAILSREPARWRIETRERVMQDLGDRARSKEQKEAREALTAAMAAPGPIDAAGIKFAVAGAFSQAARNTSTVRMTYTRYGEERLTYYAALPGQHEEFAIKAAAFAPYWATVNGDPAAPQPNEFLDAYARQEFARSVVWAMFLAFLLPLFALSYAGGAIDAEREGRTLIWLLTRPLPRWAVYLAKLLAVLPWCVGGCLLAFGLLCLAGGDLGRHAAAVYWPVAVAAAVGFGCLFHMIGAVFRYPTVIGLVYVFFYETLVAHLLGSLKQFTLNYYIRSLFYARLTADVPHQRASNLDLYAPTGEATAWATVLVVAALATALGAWLFGRIEPKETG
ncbi:MAG: ABC transporter permease subunit [Gemmataceae bacterium]